MKRKHLIIIVAIVCIAAAIGVFGALIPKHKCTWKNKYDSNGNILSEECLYLIGKEPAQGIYYEYDEDGNLLRCESKDYEYDEASFVLDYTDGDPTKNWDYTLTYDEDGRLKSFATGVHSDFGGKHFTYSYDKEGRIAEIGYESTYFGQEEKLTAKFSYKLFSDNYTARVYDEEGRLAAKYVYKHNRKGQLSKVKVYMNDLETEWATGYMRFQYDYPGGEIPDSMLLPDE